MRYFTFIFTVLLFVSCASIQVYSDFDRSIDFSKFKTFAFFKPQIDQVDISDLDKRRILKALDTELISKGLSKSETPDILIGFSTKAKEKIYVNTINSFGWGWGWGFNPWLGGPNTNTVNTRTEGTLYINIIDGVSKQLIWQGKGRGGIDENMKERDERISIFVQEIIENYPPISTQNL